MLTDKELLKFIKGFDIQDGYYVVRTSFPELWRLYRSNDENINVKRDDQDIELCFYYGLVDVVELQDIYDLIGETISINIDAENKVKLLQAKYEELKDVFSKHTLEELQQLRFVIGKSDDTKSKEQAKVVSKKPELPTIGEASKSNTLTDAVPDKPDAQSSSVETKTKSIFKRGASKGGATTKKLGEPIQTTLIPLPAAQPKKKEALQPVEEQHIKRTSKQATAQSGQTLMTTKSKSLEDVELELDNLDAELANIGY